MIGSHNKNNGFQSRYFLCFFGECGNPTAFDRRLKKLKYGKRRALWKREGLWVWALLDSPVRESGWHCVPPAFLNPCGVAFCVMLYIVKDAAGFSRGARRQNKRTLLWSVLLFW
jgi:hypothetical protein